MPVAPPDADGGLTMMKVLAAAVALGTLLTVVTVASADHSWSGYHWPGDNLSPTVVDNTTSPLFDVPAGTVEWANLGTPIQPTLTTATEGNITVTEAVSDTWLGLARIYVVDGHITQGEVKLNTELLAYYETNGYPGIADHALCQEIGHVLGLDHNRDGAIGGTPDDSCMNDQGHLGDYTSPNSHDTDQLNLIYNHSDTTGSVPTDGDGGCKGGPKKCGGGGGGGGGGCTVRGKTDTDCDGMIDKYENLHACLDPVVADANADPDADEVTNIDEMKADTDPCVAGGGGGGGGGCKGGPKKWPQGFWLTVHVFTLP